MKDTTFLEAISQSLGSKTAKPSKKEHSAAAEKPVFKQGRKPGDVMPEAESPSPPPAEASEAKPGKAKYKILTVSLFENDIHAIGAIRERLQSVLRSDTINRSDAVKVAARYALEADAAVLARLYREVKGEDGRFKTGR